LSLKATTVSHLGRAFLLAAGSALCGSSVVAQEPATSLCERYWGVPEVRAKLRVDCSCVGRYLTQIKADPVDIEVHLRLFASVYTGKAQEEANALRAKFGAERYQSALERSRNFLSGMMKDGGCRLGS
jgi:hypothetical protein